MRMEKNALHYFNADLAEQNAKLQVANEELQKKLSAREADALFYKNRYELLIQKLYGKQSEKRQISTSTLQQVLPGFGDEPRPAPPAAYEKIEYTRQKKAPEGTRGERSSRFPDWLRREVEEVKPATTKCPCCNEEMTKAVKPEVTEKLCCSRDPFYVKEYHRHLYTCASCETAATKPPLPEVFPRSLFDHTTVAFATVNKFRYGIPIVRQGKTYVDLGIKVSSDSLVRSTNDGLQLLKPVYTAQGGSVISSGIAVADDTRLDAATGRVHKKLASYKRGCLWGIYGDQNEVYYEFSSSRSHEKCHSVLADFAGYLVVDGYDGFERLPTIGNKVILAHCNNHARRQFVEAEKSDPKLAQEALAFYQALYKIEDECKQCAPDDRKTYRRQYSVPVLDRFKEWLAKVSLTVVPKTPLAKAVVYVLRRWETLTRYLDDGRIPFDTMQIERAFRTVAVGRKNFLHCSSELGAESAAIAFTLIISCELQGIDPFIYLSDVLERIGSHTNAADLIPRVWKTRFLDEAVARYGIGLSTSGQSASSGEAKATAFDDHSLDI